MRSEYDLSKLNSRPNPYARERLQSVTLDVSEDVMAYFQNMAVETGVPHLTLMRLYLRDCMLHQRKINVQW